MDSFKDYIAVQNSLHPFLCICHICDLNTFRLILNRNTLEANSEFRYEKVGATDNVLYLFYGRPAYRISKPENPNQIPAYYPVCFLINYEKFSSIKRIFPFDTGAFFIEEGYFRHFHHSRKLRDFELLNDKDTPAKLIKYFYGDNKKYYEVEPIKDLEIPGMNLEVIEYYELIKDRGKSVLDDRKASIEIQFDNDISLSKEDLAYIVIPERYFDENDVKTKLISDWELTSNQIGMYTAFSGSPKEYVSTIIDKVKAFYESKGLL